MKNNNHCAEVIESSLSGWLAQSWQWDTFPSFGSLVTIHQKNRILFGIVYQIQTGSMDQTRYPFAYQKTEEELLREQPQIFEFLKTTFSCLTVGYYQDATCYYQIAPEPPKIHAFVSTASLEQQQQFFMQEDYLHILFGFSHQIINLNELLLALLTYRKNNNLLSAQQLEHFVQTVSLLQSNDYRMLKLFLQRAEQVVK